MNYGLIVYSVYAIKKITLEYEERNKTKKTKVEVTLEKKM